MRKRRQIEVFSISFLDLLSGALGAVIILYVAIPKNRPDVVIPKNDVVRELLTADLQKSQDEIAKLKKQLAIANEKLIKVPAAPANEDGNENFDIGFKFKGKNIVFVIDTSLSMIDEDRMGQVRAGVKMLITALPSVYRIEVIQYPFAERAPFKSLWGDLKDNTGINKRDAFDFIYRLRPHGGTPTRDVLLFALRNYTSASDIVLLTDGAPTFHNSNKRDDIFDILRVVREENSRNVQINSIGVGSDFIHDKTNDRYKFLSLLSQESGGFFVGF